MANGVCHLWKPVHMDSNTYRCYLSRHTSIFCEEEEGGNGQTAPCRD